MKSSKWPPKVNMDIIKYLKHHLKNYLQVKPQPDCHVNNIFIKHSRVNQNLINPPITLNPKASMNANEEMMMEVKSCTDGGLVDGGSRVGSEKTSQFVDKEKEAEVSMERNVVEDLDGGFTAMMKKINLKPSDHSTVEIEVTGYRNVYLPD